MSSRIDAVAGGAQERLLPVDPIQHGRRTAPDDEPAPDPALGAAYVPQPAGPVDLYGPAVVTNFVPLDPVAPALAEALAAEPWGHPMPEKAVWEKAAEARERALVRTTEATPAGATAAIPAPTAPAVGEQATPATPVATTAAAPATHAAVASAGSAAPVLPAWLTSLRKAR